MHNVHNFRHDVYGYNGRVRLDQVDRGREKDKWSHHLILWSRNHVYSALTWKDLSFYQSTGLKSRYALGRC